MKMTYPSRNEARSLIKKVLEKYSKSNPFKVLPKEELIAHLILLYIKNLNIDVVKFVFTNAMIDVLPNLDVDSENSVDTWIRVFNSKSVKQIEEYFEKELNISIEKIYSQLNTKSEYSVTITKSKNSRLDENWFNNCDNFIFPLVSAYSEFKKERGMLFQNDDINQIAIDYSVVMCYNHFIGLGSLFSNPYCCIRMR
jgi:hypothetical protein